MAKIILQPGRPEERVLSILEGLHVIGNEPGSDIQCADPAMAPRHALLNVNAQGAILEALDGLGSIFCEGEAIDFKVLIGGEIFKCGETTFVFVHEVLPPPQDGAFDPERTLICKADVAPQSIEEIHSTRREAGAEVRLQILLQVNAILSSPGSIDSVLERILDLVFRILDVDRAAVLMVTEAGELEQRIAKMRDGSEPKKRIFSQSIVTLAREQRSAALIADAAADARMDMAQSIVQPSIRCSMCAPFLRRSKESGRDETEVLGVLYVDNLTTPNCFGEQDLEFLSAFAAQAAIAIENSRLYEQLAAQAVKTNTLSRFFPPAVVKHLSETEIVTTDTEITALFSDISAFTAMSARMSPRQVVELLNEYFPNMVDIVFKYDGTLEKYIGDALMAVWGWPYRRPDDPGRAVKAAILMQRAMKALNGMKGASNRFEIHIGINSGPVAAGNIGSDKYIQYATIGDTTNVAARACGCAQEGQIVITDRTYQLLEQDRFPIEDAGTHQVKGKDRPLQLYRVLWEEAPRNMDE